MRDLPKFRRIEDVQRYLEEMSKNVDVTEQLVTQQQALLSKLRSPTDKLRTVLAVSFDVFDVSPSKKVPRKAVDNSVVAPSINKVVIPNVSKLQDQYGLMEELNSQRVTLNSIETQMAMQFPDRRQGPAYAKATGSLNELRHKVDEQLRKVFDFLSSVAHKHVPAPFTEYVDAVTEALSNRIHFEDSQRFLYVSVMSKKLYFTEYVLLQNSANDEGRVAPHLYIVIQWEVGGEVNLFVEHEFTPPHQLGSGHAAASAHQALDVISHLLDIEGFSVAIGQAPLSLNMKINPTSLKPSMFQARNYLSQVMVSDAGDELIFKFRAKLNEETRNKVAYLVFQDAKAMMRTRKTKMRMKVSATQVSIFISDLAQGDEVSTNDVEFLRDRYGLSDSAVNKIALIINREKATA